MNFLAGYPPITFLKLQEVYRNVSTPGISINPIYVHVEYSTYKFSEESKGGGIHSFPPVLTVLGVFKNTLLRYRKNRGL